MFDTLLPFIPDAGATIIIFALLAYAWNQAKQAHDRSMARDAQNAEVVKQLIDSLIDCLKCKD
jgi:hypothetical protein